MKNLFTAIIVFVTLVSHAFDVSFTSSSSTIGICQSVTFTNTSPVQAQWWDIDYGDGNTDSGTLLAPSATIGSHSYNAAGVYQVIFHACAKDSVNDGCSSDTITITVVELDFDVNTIPTCQSSSNGSITIVPTNGINISSVVWSVLGSGTSITNLATGNYAYTITDEYGCTYTGNTNVDEVIFTDEPSVSYNICEDNVANFSIGINVNDNIEHVWDFGDGTSEQGATVSHQYAMGSYTVTSTQTSTLNPLCSHQNTLSVEFTDLVFSVSDETLCLGDELTINLTNIHELPVIVSIDGVSIPGNTQSEWTHTFTQTGTYEISWVELKNSLCGDTIEVVVSDIPTIDITDATCPEVCDGELTVNLPVIPFEVAPTFTWSNGATTQTITDLCGNTDYYVTITDNFGCETIDTVHVGVVSDTCCQWTDFVFAYSNTGCEPFGSASVTYPSATATYIWSTSSTASSISGLLPGSYSVTVTDTDPIVCDTIINFDVLDGGKITLTPTIEPASCIGETDGSISLIPGGGPSPFTFAWSNSMSGSSITGIAAGTYTVTATDASACYTIEEFILPAESESCCELEYDINTVLPCEGMSNGSITITPTNGIGITSVNWSNSDSGVSISGLSDGVYTFTITDVDDCVHIDSVNVEEIILNSSVDTSHTICQDNLILFNYEVYANVDYHFDFGDGTSEAVVLNMPGYPPSPGQHTYGQTSHSYPGFEEYTAVFTQTSTINPACTSTETFQITNYDEGITVSDETICLGDDVIISYVGVPDHTVYISVGGIEIDSIVGSGEITHTFDEAGSFYVVYTYKDEACGDSINVIVSGLPTIETVGVSCSAVCDGEASITLPSIPFEVEATFVWSHGETTQQVTNLCANTDYYVTITDNFGCETIDTVNLGSGDDCCLEFEVENISTCQDAQNGSVTINPMNGVDILSVNWSNGATGLNLTNLDYGNYSYTIIDEDSCTYTGTVLVDSVSFEIINFPEECNDLFVRLSAHGLAPASSYNVVWDFGDGTSATGSVVEYEYADYGVYTVTATATSIANPACIIENTFEATLTNRDIVLSDSTLCLGDVITIAYEGGVDDYPVEIFFNNELLYTGTDAWETDITLNQPGDFEVILSRRSECGDTASFVVSSNNPTIETVNASCPTICDGEAVITLPVLPPEVDPTFIWSNGETTQEVNNLCPNTDYQVTITDNFGCESIETVNVGIISEQCCEWDVSAVVVDASCGPDGSITTSITGAVGTISYDWSTDETTSSINNLMAGEYSVSISDEANCDTVLTFNIENTSGFSVSITSTMVSTCECNRSATAEPVGGVAPYTYEWQYASGATFSNEQTIEGFCIAWHKVIVTDANGCQASKIAMYDFGYGIEPEFIVDDASCETSADGSATVTIIGGETPFTYEWSNGQDAVTATGLEAGITYQVTVYDNTGCPVVREVTIGAEEEFCCEWEIDPVIVHPECTATGSITTNVTNTIGTVTYSWSNGATTPSISNLFAGEYSVTINNESICDTILNFDLINESGLTVNIDVDASTCACERTFTPVVTGGTAPYTYAWINEGQTVPFSTEMVQEDVCIAWYNLIVTDANGCQATDYVRYDYAYGVFPDFDVEVADCPTSCDAEATVTIIGGETPFTYLWSNAQTEVTATGLCAGTTYQVTVYDNTGCPIVREVTPEYEFEVCCTWDVSVNTTDADCICDGTINITNNGTSTYSYEWPSNMSTGTSASDVCSGTYEITITDDVDLCSTTVTAEVLNSSNLLVEISSVQLDPCVCDFTLTAEAEGGTLPFNYDWSTGESTQSIEITDDCTGTYIVRVTDDQGCIAIDEFTINAPIIAVNATATTNDAECPGMDNGSILITGEPSYTYAWENGSSSPNLFGLGEGTYPVTITSQEGCTLVLTPEIGVEAEVCPEDPTDPCGNFTIGMSGTDLQCYGDESGQVNVELIGGSGIGTFTYEWSNGNDDNLAQINNLTAGTYSVTVTDALGCVAEGSYTITQPAQSNISITAGGPTTFCQGSSITLTAAGTNSNVEWSTGETTNTIIVSQSGTYTVQTDDECHDVSEPITVNVNGYEAHITDFCDGNLVTLTSSHVNGNVWSPGGETSQSITVSDIGLYGLTLTQGGCSDTEEFELLVIDCVDEPDAPCNMQPSPIIEIDDDCAEELINGAISNAQNDYAVYIDSLRDAFQEAYIEKCLDVYEDFHMKYTEKATKQYTLYFYDQAGNLIKTVPPQGIQFIEDTDDLQQVREDRENGEKTVPTEHTMSTVYKYNSLNQLVYQDVPDNTRIDIWEPEMSNTGLPSNANIGSTYFTDNDNGFVIGTDEYGNGLIYITEDGGETWESTSSFAVGDLADVTEIEANVAYAVGESGACIRTEDAGLTWSILNIGTNKNLINVFNITGGVFAFAKDGTVWKSEDNGVNWLQQPATIPSAFEITDVSTDGTDCFATASNGVKNQMYVLTDGVWYENNNINAEEFEFRDIDMLNSGMGFAIANDGRLFSLQSDKWQQIATNNRFDIKRIHAIDNNQVWLLDQSNNLIRNEATNANDFDTWTNVLSNVVDFYFVDALICYAITNSGSGEEIKCTTDGATSWETLSGMNPPISGATALYATGTTTGHLYLAKSGEILTYPLDDLTSGTSLFTPLVVNPSKIRSEFGRFYVYDKQAQETYSISATLATGPVYQLSKGFAHDKDNSKVYITEDSDLKMVSVGLGETTLASIPDEINRLSVENAKVYMAGTEGILGLVDSQDALPTYNDQSSKLNALPLNGIDCKDNTIYAAGKDGTVLINESGVWTFVDTESIIDFNTIGVKDANTIVAAGILEGGHNILERGSSNSLTSVSSENINNLAVDGSAAYLFTESGQVYKDDGMALTFSLPSSAPAGTVLNEPSISGGISSGLVVADNGKIYTIESTEAVYQTAYNPPVLTDVEVFGQTCIGVGHGVYISEDGGLTWNVANGADGVNFTGLSFYNSTHGYAVGPNVLYATTDGGLNWTAVSGTPVSNFKDLAAVAENKVILCGSGGIHKYDGLSFTPMMSPTNVNALYDVNHSVVYYVGHWGNIYKTYDGGETWTDLSYDGGSKWTTEDLNDVYFRSLDEGFAIGDNGTILKTINGGYEWFEHDVDAGGEDLNSITFFNGNNAFISGTGTTEIALLDEGEYTTRYWYDRLGRVVASQNSKQFNLDPPRYSYKKYDALGRVVEAGEIASSVQPSEALLNDPAYPSNWSTFRTEVVQTQYDYPYSTTINSLFGSEGQQNLRTRISTSMIYDVYDDNAINTYNHATHYNYDIHGNVNVLIKDFPELEDLGQRYKNMKYEYDLISGNIFQVTYQEGELDMMIHQYVYDADNRITQVLTSTDGINWDRDAKYFYYAHGPLARIELGHDKVQGLDYAYTVQSWLKGVNSETVNTSRDMGKDAKVEMANEHANVAADEFGYSLGYYQGDYSAINNPTSSWLAERTGSPIEDGVTTNLFNGNISSMVTGIRQFMQSAGDDNQIFVKRYKYDQLNRLKESAVWKSEDVASTNSWASAEATDDYGSEYTYDANGNLLTLKRNANINSQTDNAAMDNLEYHYDNIASGGVRNTNKLLSVTDHTDNTGNSSFDGIADFKPGQLSYENYTYNEIGSLIEDKQEEIAEILWTISGKVKAVVRTPESTKPDLEFCYDELGNRIKKKVINKDPLAKPLVNIEETFYIHDAQANVMSIYTRRYFQNLPGEVQMQFDLQEHNLYGNSRLGLYRSNKVLVQQTYDVSGPTEVLVNTEQIPNQHNYKLHHKGFKEFELTNHLGNVLATVADNRAPIFHTITQEFANFEAISLTANHLYPFGMIMPSEYNLNGNYRFGFNGMEMDNEVNGSLGTSYTTHFRQYGPRLGRWLSVDPQADRGPWMSPYAYSFNNPLIFVDKGGDWPSWSSVLDGVQLGLDVVGMIPVVGNIADVVNAGVSVARGNYAEAALNLAAAIPGAGLAVGAGKIGYKVTKLVTKHADEVIEIGVKVTDKVAGGSKVIDRTGKVIKSGTGFPGSNPKLIKEVSISPKYSPTQVIEKFKKTGGVYIITTKSGQKYVGQSKHIGKRIKQHGKKRKFKKDPIENVEVKKMDGTQWEREILEQKNLDALGGVEKTLNKKNPVKQGGAREKIFKKDGSWDKIDVNGKKQ